MLARLGVGCLAGPSRLALRISPLSVSARAPLFRQQASGLGSLRLLSTSRARLVAVPREAKPPPKMSEKEWPWRAVAAPSAPGASEVERVIFARPINANPKGMWIFGIIWAAGVTVWLLQPQPKEFEQYFARTETEPYTILGIPSNLIQTYVMSGLVTALTVGGVVAGLLASRMITRLSLVRRTAGAETEEFVRMKTMGQEMLFGARNRPRDIPREQCSTHVVLGRPLPSGARKRTPWVSLWVRYPGSDAFFSRDRWSYRMDFADSPRLDTMAQNGAEVVISVRRVEDTFGALTPLDKMVQHPPRPPKGAKK